MVWSVQCVVTHNCHPYIHPLKVNLLGPCNVQGNKNNNNKTSATFQTSQAPGSMLKVKTQLENDVTNLDSLEGKPGESLLSLKRT